MAPTLLGEHYQMDCDDCGYRFVCGADPPVPSGRVRCPNCGHVGNDLAGRPVLWGDAVLIDRAALIRRSPRRWEPVALRQPLRSDRLCVKRVVGLPGEHVEIRHGDVYIDGRIARKPYRVQWAMAVIVQDAAHRPKGESQPAGRWQPVARDSRWGEHLGRFACGGGALAIGRPAESTPSNAVSLGRESEDFGESVDWLVYRHGNRQPDGTFQLGPITDLNAYNQVRARRVEDVHAVPDILLQLRLERLDGPGSLIVELTDGRDRFGLRLLPGSGRYSVSRNGQVISAAEGELARPLADRRLVLSLIDRQFLVTLDDRTLVKYPIDAPSEAPEPLAEPVRIGAVGVDVVINRPRVYRDVYYTNTPLIGRDPGCVRGCQLGENEYFVLGDNSPIAEDSRQWRADWAGSEGVAAAAGAAEGSMGDAAAATQADGGHDGVIDSRMLIGRPVVVWFPARAVRWGRWEFQVPEPSRIRYIR